MSTHIEVQLDLYDEGQLPPEEQVQLMQLLIDMDMAHHLTEYQQFCEYCIAEELCYDVKSQCS